MAACTRWGFAPQRETVADSAGVDQPRPDVGDAARDGHGGDAGDAATDVDAAADAADDGDGFADDAAPESAPIPDQGSEESVGADSAPDLADAALDGSTDGGTPGLLSWVSTFGGDLTDKANAVAVSAGGKTVVVGGFQGQIDFGAGPTTSKGGTDIFVVMLDSTGEVIQAATFGGAGHDIATEVAVDDSSGVYVAGSTAGGVDFGGGAVPPGGFLVALTGGLLHRWSIGPGGDAVSGLAVRDDFVHLAASFAGKVDLGGGQLEAVGGSDFYIAALKSDGSHVWSFRYGDAADDVVHDIASDAAGVFATGGYRGSLVIGAKTLTSVGEDDTWLARLAASDGSADWAISFGTSTADQGAAVAVGKNHVVVGAYYDQTIEIEPGISHAAAGQSDVLLVSYEKLSNSYAWSVDIASVGPDQIGALAVSEENDDVFVTGSFSDTVMLKGAVLHSAGMQDVFFGQLTVGGAVLSGESFGGAADDHGRGVAVRHNLAVIAGTFRKTVDFGGGPIPGGDAGDIFALGLGL